MLYDLYFKLVIYYSSTRPYKLSSNIEINESIAIYLTEQAF